MSTENIKALSEKFYPEVKALRHYFHMNPELSFKEYGTAKRVAEVLESLGIETQTGVAETGVVGLIRGAAAGPTVLLRADMDALLLQEEADVPYRSQVPGVMHACGHDGHTAGLLGAAMILNELKDQFKGNIKLVFQPAEENEGGALPMIEAGVMENPKVDAAFGCHLWGNLKEGQIELKKGPMMASPDMFNIKIIGRGGHAALPHLSIDPISISAQVINEFQTIISRRKNPVQPAVISVSMIHGGETHNVIPNTVEMCGTIRVFDKEVRKWIPEAMESVLKHVTETNGASYEFYVEKRFPPLINDSAMTELVEKSAVKLWGSERVEWSDTPNMGGEDFAYFAEHVPSSFFFVGIAPDESEPVSHHHPKFAWNDDVLKISMQTLAQVAIDFLNQETPN